MDSFFEERIKEHPNVQTPLDMSEFLTEWNIANRESTFKSKRHGTGSNLPVDRTSFNPGLAYPFNNHGWTTCGDTIWRPNDFDRDMIGAPMACFDVIYNCDATYSALEPPCEALHSTARPRVLLSSHDRAAQSAHPISSLL